LIVEERRPAHASARPDDAIQGIGSMTQPSRQIVKFSDDAAKVPRVKLRSRKRNAGIGPERRP
jgi:hypothetical protein